MEKTPTDDGVTHQEAEMGGVTRDRGPDLSGRSDFLPVGRCGDPKTKPHREGLIDALRATNRAGGNIEANWSLERPVVKEPLEATC